MSADSGGDHLDGLSAHDRQRLDLWIQAFGHGWDEGRWARAISRLSANEPLRRPALLEIAKVDMARRREKGQSVTIDNYLTPDLEPAADGLPHLNCITAVEVSPVEAPRMPSPEPAPALVLQSAAEVGIAPIRPPIPSFTTPAAEPAPHRPRATAVTTFSREYKDSERSSTWKWAVGAVVVMAAGAAFFVWSRDKPAPIAVATPSMAEATPVGPLQPDDPVRSVSVKLHVGDGADLADRIGLDLGLGFPLWLAPLGADPTRPAPFGAMPQQGPSDAVLKAGAEATFTFAADGDSGRDVLHTSRQLLAGVRVRDIRRVGFIGPVTSNWELASCDVKVNGRTIVTNSPHVLPRKLIEKSLDALTQVGRKLRPLEQKWIDLREMVDARLATQAEYREQKDLLAVMAPDVQQRARLEARLQGNAPWFIADNLELPAVSSEALLKSVRVIVWTRDHLGADSRNYIYMTFGAAKYLLGSPDRPLGPFAGPQTFDLDLDAAPQTFAAVRRCSFGMLAHSLPQGDVPDRWHPQRIVIEVDGKVELDSDRLDKDRLSLNAIRLVPPAQIDWAGKPRDIHPCPREMTEWSFNSGAGLNSDLSLMPFSTPDEPAPPRAEPSTRGATAGSAQSIFSNSDLTDGALNFPGEVRIIVAPSPKSDGRGNQYSTEFEARPVGRSFQLRDVQIVDGLRADDRYTVKWGLAGDEGAVDHYEVCLVRIRPDNSPPGHVDPMYGDQFALDNHVPPGIRQITASPAQLANLAFDPLLTIRPFVRAVPADAARNRTNERFGPARPVFPRSPVQPPLILHGLFWKGHSDSPPLVPPDKPSPPSVLSVGGTSAAGAAVWQTGPIECNGVIYSGDGPTPNITMRLTDPAEQNSIWLRSGVLPPTTQNRELTAHLGFANDTPGQVEARMTWFSTPAEAAGAVSSPWQTIVAPNVAPMRMVIPPQSDATILTVRFDFRRSTGGATSRPTLIGVRLVEQPSITTSVDAGVQK